MGKLYVKTGGSWTQVKEVWVKNSGVWSKPSSGFVKDTTIKQFYPTNRLSASSNTYYNYTFTSGQGGYGNGGYNSYQPSGESDISDGYRSGDIYYPTSRNSSDSYNGWVTYLEPNNFTSLSDLYTALTTSGSNAAFNSVTWVSSSGTTQSFTAVLNTGYHCWVAGNNSVSGGVTYPCLMKAGDTITFYVDSTQSGIGVGTNNRTSGRTRFAIFNNQGCLFTNSFSETGTVNVSYAITGSGKLGNIRILIDGAVYSTQTNGDSGCGGKSYSNNFGQITLPAGSSVLIQSYWWGCGNFQYGVNYVSGGSWTVKADLVNWYQ